MHDTQRLHWTMLAGVIAAAVVSGCGAGTISEMTPDAADVEAELTASRLMFSESADRASPRVLAGASLSGSVYIFVSNRRYATSVEFVLDGNQAAAHVDSESPWDLVGTNLDGSAAALVTASLKDGDHQLKATVKTSWGTLRALSAAFTVRNGAVVADAGQLPVADAGVKPVIDAGVKPTVDAGTSPVVDAGTPPVVTPPGTGGRTCPAFPAFPDESCTGVPAGYALATVNGDLVTSAVGQVIDGKLITGDLDIDHDNVKVTNTRIKGRVWLKGHKGLVLQDVDIGADACPAVSNGGFRLIVGDSGYTLIRAHLHHNADDMLSIGGGPPTVIQDSLVHKPCIYPGDHLDAVQFYDPGGVGHITITHSRIDVRPANSSDTGNAAIIWADRPGAGSTLNVSQTLFAGGNYALMLFDSGAGSGVTIDVRDSRFVRNSYGVSACSLGAYIPANHSPTIQFNGVEGLTWTNNAYDDGVPLPSCQ